jgi:Spy/CpxP family protein refolding chaperone
VRLYNWRWKSVILGAIALGIATYAADFLPLGMSPPYAMADTTSKIQEEFQHKLDATNSKLDLTAAQIAQVQIQLKDGQIRQLNSDLIDARRYQCRSINSNDKSALPFWNSRLQVLKLAYEQLAGIAWPDLPCNSF